MRTALPWSTVLLVALGCGGGRAPAEPAAEPLRWSVPGDGRPSGDAPASPNAPPSPEPPAPPPADAPMTPLDADRTTDLCRDPLRARVRQVVRDIPVCERGVPARFVSVVHGGQQAIVVGYRDDRPTWVDGVARYGSAVVLDGARLDDEDAERFWTHLDGLEELAQPEVPSLLQGVLLQRRVFRQIPTFAQAEEALSGWPEALEVVRARPPGMYADRHGHHMRVWSHRTEAGLGVRCRYLTRHELMLTHEGHVHMHPGAEWAEGTRQGEPCGPDLPAP